MVESRLTMNYHLHPEDLARLSAQLEELFSKVSAYGSAPLPQELADEIAVTAGEIMVELADHRGDELARGVIDDARHLRGVARSLRPEAAQVAEAGRTLFSDLEAVIRGERRAA